MNNQNKDKKRKFNAFIENSKHFSFISDFDLKHNKNNSNENYNNYISDQNHNLSFTQNINLLNNDQRIYKRYFPNTESKRDFIDNNDKNFLRNTVSKNYENSCSNLYRDISMNNNKIYSKTISINSLSKI